MPVRSCLLLASISLLAGCQDLSPTSGTLIGPSGGTVVSADGSVQVTVPPGALDREARISVSPRAVSGDPAPDGSRVLAAVDLTPEGLAFLEPVELEMRVPAPLEPDGRVGVAAILGPDGNAVGTSRARLDRDTGTLSALTTTRHFSEFVVVYFGGNAFGSLEVPHWKPVSETFRGKVKFEKLAGQLEVQDARVRVTTRGNFLEGYAIGNGAIPRNGPGQAVGEGNFVCMQPGPGFYDVRIYLVRALAHGMTPPRDLGDLELEFAGMPYTMCHGTTRTQRYLPGNATLSVTPGMHNLGLGESGEDTLLAQKPVGLPSSSTVQIVVDGRDIVAGPVAADGGAEPTPFQESQTSIELPAFAAGGASRKLQFTCRQTVGTARIVYGWEDPGIIVTSIINCGLPEEEEDGEDGEGDDAEDH